MLKSDAVITVDAILERALRGEDLLPEEGVVLLRQTDPEAIAYIRQTADQLRHQQAGDTVTYVINRNINFTNICEQHCSFCAFRRDEGEDGAFWLNTAQILEKATDAVRRDATEICMQGGLNLQAKLNDTSLAYYLRIVKAIKEQFPQLHLHAFSPQEVQFIAREDNLSYGEVIAAFQDAGVDSMPGTAAEVLDDEVRRVLCPEKIDSATWLEIVETAHRLGMPTTSTMLSGHIETPEQQIGHLQRLRALQQTAIERGYPAKITEFIILPFVGQEAPKPLRRRVGRDQPMLADALLLTAVSRIFLGRWIPNHQPSWVKLGLAGATEALRWGCNDIGGTLMEEHITTMAGAQGGTCMEVETLQEAIRSLGRPYQQRDTLYRYLPTAEVATNL
jgi:FO synthase subunit 2